MIGIHVLYLSPALTETEKELKMPILKRPGTWRGCVAALVLAALSASCGGAPSVQGTPTPLPCNTSAAASATSVPPGAPVEDVSYATEWPSPNQNLYNTRVAHSTIASTNVSKLGMAWTIPLQGKGATGADVANPVIANGIAYLQDGASNVIAVQVCDWPGALDTHVQLSGLWAKWRDHRQWQDLRRHSLWGVRP